MRSTLLILAFMVAPTAACSGDSPTEGPVPQKPAVTLSVDRSVAYQGLDTIAITWSAQNAQSCSASGAWQGERPPSGSERVLPTVSGAAEFRLSCSNTAGVSDAVRSVDVRVLAHNSCRAERFEDMGQPNGPVQMGQYVVTNSVGDAVWDQIPGYSSCTSSQMTDPAGLAFSIDWNIPLPHKSAFYPIVGYPNVTVGRVDHSTEGSTRSTTPRLPMRVQDVPESMTIQFDAEYGRTGQFLTLVDIWIFKEANGTFRQQKELMLTLDVIGGQFGNPEQPILDLGGLKWQRYGPSPIVRPSPSFPNDSTSYFGAVNYYLVPWASKASIPLKPILDDLIGTGFISPDEWIVSVQWGVEPSTGTGRVTVQRYEVTW